MGESLTGGSARRLGEVPSLSRAGESNKNTKYLFLIILKNDEHILTAFYRNSSF